LVGYEPREATLEKALSYTDKKVEFELSRIQKSAHFWRQKLGEEEFKRRVDALKAERKKSLLFRDEEGLFTYSGLGSRIAVAGSDVIERRYNLPDFDIMPWANKPKYKDRPYQVEAHDKLIEAVQHGPCGVELATGAGKSTIIRNVLKTIALEAVVMAPSKSIAGQLYDDLCHHFGKRYVGMVGDGKKDFKKHIVVAIDDSLSLVEPGTEIWNALSSKPVFIADESHLCPAQSLAKVCFGLMKNAPYRMFFSATQMRNDGLDLVLDGITGNIVIHKNVRELVDEGYLAKPIFKIVKCQSNSSYDSKDAVLMTRKHLFYNRIVTEIAADLANKFVSHMKRPTIILVEEVEQFGRLLPHLKHEARFAHGPLTKENKESVPEAYHKDKPKDLVQLFNEGKLPILVGTSCIATGTDIQVAEAEIYLMGGKSEIKVKQGLGRETRGGFKGSVVNPWTGKQKLDSIHVDFEVSNIDILTRHADERASIYADVYDAPSYIDMTDFM
jgi:superfamily II DNA or RNA helicase